MVRDTEARPKVLPVPFDVEIAVDSTNTANAEKPGAQVEQAAIGVLGYVLGIDDVPAQTVGNGQL